MPANQELLELEDLADRLEPRFGNGAGVGRQDTCSTIEVLRPGRKH